MKKTYVRQAHCWRAMVKPLLEDAGRIPSLGKHDGSQKSWGFFTFRGVERTNKEVDKAPDDFYLPSFPAPGL